MEYHDSRKLYFNRTLMRDKMEKTVTIRLGDSTNYECSGSF